MNRILVAVLLVASTVTTVRAAEIRGSVIGDDGPLVGVPVCLVLEDVGTACRRVVTTDRRGQYAFTKLRRLGNYAVEILTTAPENTCRPPVKRTRSPILDDAQALDARPQARLSNYIWDPERAPVELTPSQSSVAEVDFAGTFSYNNFHRTLCLSRSNFPELAQFDTFVDFVFLKLYAIDATTEEQQLIYLGQVNNPSTLSIEASVPLAVTELQYQIYGTVGSADGVLTLDNGQTVNP